jgi:hypothetical protein
LRGLDRAPVRWSVLVVLRAIVLGRRLLRGLDLRPVRWSALVVLRAIVLGETLSRGADMATAPHSDNRFPNTTP